jgi:surface protein
MRYLVCKLIIVLILLINACGTESTNVYTLKTSVIGEGSVIPSRGEFKDGEMITLTAMPSYGWGFSEWSGDGSGSSNPMIITVYKEMNVTVIFEPLFSLAENGVTIECPNTSPGDKGMLNGVEYESVDKNLLIQRRNEGSDLSEVCVSLVTDMSGMFHNSEFNQPIGNWDVSNVTHMGAMFSQSSFNQSIGDWDVGNVKDMSWMFDGSEFNQHIGRWDVGNVTDMSWMFNGSEFNQPIGDWNVSRVMNMSYMFYQSLFNQPIGGWNVGMVTNMTSMFHNSEFNQPIGNWDVSNVTVMEGMFAISPFNQPINRWCVTHIISEPSGFSLGSPLPQEYKPVWGTCPD